jgi:hypothetical protein
MPDIRLYLPDDLWIKLKKEKNMSKLVQDLLKEYWSKKDNKRGRK